jgi:UDP-N-acetylglucosamine 2-epimerase (non-hydrolysing)
VKAVIVLGTRPEIIKMSPIIRECEKQGLDYFILHTGQHYSYNLDGIFFDQLKLPKPKYNLGVGSGTYAEEVSKMLLGIERILLEEKPSIVLVEGDTNSCLGGALAASKCGIKIGHVEAGLRSYFEGMPEEINRVLVDHCSNYLFAPTEKSKEILIGEGIPDSKIFVTGNTIVDAVYQNLESVENSKHYPVREKYALATVHRQENVDDKERFLSIMNGLGMVSIALKMPVVYPIHPRAKKMYEKLGIDPYGIELIEPVDYLQFLWFEKNASLILTDSGGVQEEASILGVPCVTLRDNTERPETSPQRIVECAEKMLGKKYWSNPFGDGKAAERIVGIIRRQDG